MEKPTSFFCGFLMRVTPFTMMLRLSTRGFSALISGSCPMRKHLTHL